ncbi:MAG TPA: short-chain dehydrogenase [Chloroflexi bacterium]|jgi:short-subunit dehydrogenase|nr:short-chain dehydrogenase [Chloroflexota bacterium]
MHKRTCVVVGIGPGIGLALAKRFGGQGFQIGMLARNAERLNAYVEELSAEGIEAHGFRADASDSHSLRSALDAVAMELGDISVLLYNPSMNLGGRISELDPELLVKSFRINAIGALAASQTVLPGMRRLGGGTILFTGSAAGLRPGSLEYLTLGIGKTGLRYLAHGLAEDLKDEGIHVSTVTIRGSVTSGTFFDPELIAERFWQVYSEPKEQWKPEIMYEKA